MNNIHQQMIAEICEYFNVYPRDIFTGRRIKKIVNAKKVIYWILRKEKLTYNQIAKIVKKDHETVISGIKTIPVEYKPYAQKIYNRYKKIVTDEQLKQELEKIKQHHTKIVDMLNDNKSIKDISETLEESEDFVKKQISKNIELRKIPNYQTGTYTEKYFEKNKKNY